MVRVVEGDYSDKGRDLFRYVDVFPVGDAGGPSVSVGAGVMGEDASFDEASVVETLTDLALDERLVPTRERGGSTEVLVGGERPALIRQPNAAETTSRASSWTCARWSGPLNDSA